MKYQNPFSYNIKMFLMGKKPILLSTGLETLVKALEDQRVCVWQDGNFTNIGALRLDNTTGKLYHISNLKTVMIIPQNKLPAIIENINKRIRKDENKIKFKKVCRKSLEFFDNMFLQRSK